MRRTNSIRVILAAGVTMGLALAGAPAGMAFVQDQERPTNVEGVVVSGSGVPIPRVGPGAPAFTPLEIQEKRARGQDEVAYYTNQMQTLEDCYLTTYETQPNQERLMGYEQALEAARRLSGASVSAEQKTREAQEVRLRAARGEATDEEVVVAELARQLAVLRMMEAEQDLNEGRAVAIDIQELAREQQPIAMWRAVVGENAANRARILEDPYEMVPRQYRDLKLEDLNVVQQLDGTGAAVIRVTGAIRNTRQRRITPPPISVTAVDELGYALMTESAAGRGSIQPGEAMSFAYELKPAPILSSSVVVTFADPERPVWLLPAGADPVCTGNASIALDPRRSGRPSRVNTNVRGFITRPGGF